MLVHTRGTYDSLKDTSGLRPKIHNDVNMRDYHLIEFDSNILTKSSRK